MWWCSVVLLALFASVQGRAINISNTWVLPEEGFPVFYRYFRDRISWYEADAVCQFHHANLVTVDTTAQYDAVRAYLKELDISSAVWVGLIRSNPEGDFTWTDYRGLSGDGYWSSAPDARAAPLCAAADPAADYRWEARNCGGPTVAAFICELPVPQWALGNEGCMVRALPALTVLYLPESAAVQLTADCGLAGVKRVQCTGSVKRENLLRDLSCSEVEETTSISSVTATGVSSPITTDTAITDIDNDDSITEESVTTYHDVANYTEIAASKPIVYNLKEETLQDNNQLNSKFRILDKSNYLDNNLQSNDIPHVAHEENSLTIEQSDKLEDEKLMQHKMIHEELARLGNFETIFTQPTDHFVPPLVMAKAKLSDDMTVLSLQEKHAQQIAEEHYMKHMLDEQNDQPHEVNYSTTTENINKIYITSSTAPSTVKEIGDVKDEKKEIKIGLPKKYIEKLNDPKNKLFKIRDNKVSKNDKVTETSLTSTQNTEKEISSTTSTVSHEENYNKTDEDPTIDLTVIIKEPGINSGEKIFYTNKSGDVSGMNVGQSDYLVTKLDTKITSTESSEKAIKPQSKTETQNIAEYNNTMLNHQVIKITIIKDDATPTTMDITTKFPIFEDISSTYSPIQYTTNNVPTTDNNKYINTSVNSFIQTMKEELTTVTTKTDSTTPDITTSNDQIFPINQTTTSPSPVSTSVSTETTINSTDSVSDNSTLILNMNITETVASIALETLANDTNENIEAHNITGTHDDDHVEYITNTEEIIDDFQSPLLSGANEPVHRPPRSRRPQNQPNRIKKFNPFRILG